MKYILITLLTTHSEREYHHAIPKIINDKENEYSFAENYCKSFWTAADENSWDAELEQVNLDGITTEVYDVQNLSKREYETLKTYLPNV